MSHCILLLSVFGGLILSLPIFSANNSITISAIIGIINVIFGIVGGGCIIHSYFHSVMGVARRARDVIFRRNNRNNRNNNSNVNNDNNNDNISNSNINSDNETTALLSMLE